MIDLPLRSGSGPNRKKRGLSGDAPESMRARLETLESDTREVRRDVRTLGSSGDTFLASVESLAFHVDTLRAELRLLHARVAELGDKVEGAHGKLPLRGP